MIILDEKPTSRKQSSSVVISNVKNPQNYLVILDHLSIIKHWEEELNLAKDNIEEITNLQTNIDK